MKCPECVKQGLRSHVFIINSSSENIGDVFQYFDEDGVWHNHIQTLTIIKYRCHNYHYFQKIERSRCQCLPQDGALEILPYEPTEEERQK